MCWCMVRRMIGWRRVIPEISVRYRCRSYMMIPLGEDFEGVISNGIQGRALKVRHHQVGVLDLGRVPPRGEPPLPGQLAQLVQVEGRPAFADCRPEDAKELPAQIEAFVQSRRQLLAAPVRRP